METTIPGPKGLDQFINGLKMRSNSLGEFDRLRKQYGKTFQLTFPQNMLIVTDPKDIKRVLKDNHQNYHKGIAYEETAPILGKGLVTAEGSEWRDQRRIMAPEFNHKRLEFYYQLIAGLTDKHIEELSSGNTDISTFFNRITFDIAARAFFGLELGEEADTVRDNIHLASEITIRRVYSFTRAHKYLPLPSNFTYKKSVDELNRVVYKLIEEYQNNPDKSPNSLLSRMLKAIENEDKTHFTQELLRDEVMTLLLAGHETTANTLSWTIHLLTENLECYKKLMDEINSLNGEMPTLSNIRELEYLTMCLKESMRLLPAVPLISRRALEDDVLGGYHVKKDTSVFLIQWLVHRDDTYFKDPLTFDPERFSKEREGEFPDYAYFPFAEGPRKCIGYEFSMMESAIILVKLLQKFEITKIQGFVPQMFAGITLFSKNGMQVNLKD